VTRPKYWTRSTGLARFSIAAAAHFDQGQLLLVEQGIDDLPASADQMTLRVVAQIEAGKKSSRDRIVRLSEYAGSQTLAAQKPVIVFNVSEDNTLPEDERSRLKETGVAAVMTLPLLASDRSMLGMIHFTGDAPIDMPIARVRALSGLIEQAAVVLENRDLLRRTESSLQEARNLYSISRDLLGAQDDLDVLRVLYEQVAPDSFAASIFNLTYDEERGVPVTFALGSMVNADGAKVLNTRMEESSARHS
jgi:GAF domain-containing protein